MIVACARLLSVQDRVMRGGKTRRAERGDEGEEGREGMTIPWMPNSIDMMGSAARRDIPSLGAKNWTKLII